MTDEQKEQLNFLLADFQAIKSEIAWRSSLQKVVLTLILGFYGWLFTAKSISGISEIVVLWVVVILGQIFYDREKQEIKRLGYIISERIAKTVSGILQGVEAKDIIPSEVHNIKYETDALTSRYELVFNAILFVIIPIVFTIHFICVKGVICG